MVYYRLHTYLHVHTCIINEQIVVIEYNAKFSSIKSLGDIEWATTFAFGRKRLGQSKVVKLGPKEQNVRTHALLQAARA